LAWERCLGPAQAQALCPVPVPVPRKGHGGMATEAARKAEAALSPSAAH
jgi:hypothetical protein